MEVNIKNLTETQGEEKEYFIDKIDSKLIMNMSKKQIIDDDEWIDLVNFTIPHLEKALNKWNKQIVTEEEIIKIELIKKVSIESIKHLSKNTNFISVSSVCSERLRNGQFHWYNIQMCQATSYLFLECSSSLVSCWCLGR